MPPGCWPVVRLMPEKPEIIPSTNAFLTSLPLLS